ncbi:MAG: phosphoglycerate kinase [Candidatus Kapaibacterium sp.]
MIRTLDDLPLHSHRVLLRVDYNVPFNEEGGISDDTRIAESLPTVRKIRAEGDIAILMAHLGRPKGNVDARYSLAPVAAHLARCWDVRCALRRIASDRMRSPPSRPLCPETWSF